MSAGTKNTTSRSALSSNRDFARNPMMNVVITAITESDPERPSIPSVAFVAFIDTTKRSTARI